LRESYFGDWTNQRLPLAMLNTECVDAAQSLQVLLVPQTRFNRFPSPQECFAVPGVPDQLAAQGVPLQESAKPRAADPQDWSGGYAKMLRSAMQCLAFNRQGARHTAQKRAAL